MERPSSSGQSDELDRYPRSPTWQTSPFWKPLLERPVLPEENPPWEYWRDYRERLIFGDAPSGKHYAAPRPFEIAKRNTNPANEDTPEYIKLQLKDRITQHRASTSASSAGEAISSANPYRPLNEDEIRVLELLPASFGSPLHGRLHTASLEFEYVSIERYLGWHTLFGLSIEDGQPLCYTALSYVWGGGAADKSIMFGNHTLNITRSLDICLRHLRQGADSVMLWVDQICINQDDVTEKEQQVLMMGLIFGRAWNTVIWLGTHPDRGAFKSLDIIDGGTSLSADSMSEEEREYLCSRFRKEPEMLQALADIFRRPWFTRTWTIQEPVLSKRPYLMTGSSTIAWQDFGNCMVLRDLGILDITTKGRKVHGSIVAGLEAAVGLYQFPTFHGYGEPVLSVVSALVETRYAAVGKPVDKVYAVLGLCRHNIDPDYAKSAGAVFQEATVAAMRHELADAREKSRSGVEMALGYHGACKILCCVDHDPEEANEMPSWIPDWARPRATTSLGYTTHVALFYKAGGPFVDSNVVQVSGDNVTLVVSGKIVDTIQSLSSVVRQADLSIDKPDQNNVSLLSCIDFAKSQATLTTTVALFQPFCRTIVAGKDGTGMKDCGDRYVEVLSLLCDKTGNRCPTFQDQVYSPRQTKGYFTLDHLKRRNPGRLFQELKRAFKSAMLNRRLCWTRHGRLGLVPRFAQEGDQIVLIAGCAVPFVVRNRSEDEYTMIGECYVHGVMDGSLMKASQSSLSTLRIA